MPLETFDELREEIFRLHHAAAYDAALKLIGHEAQKFPDYAIRVDYWRMCFHALKGETAYALAAFQALLDRDDWIGEALLRHDPDLTSLQGNPDFERLVQISEQKRSRAQLQVTPKRYVSAPDMTAAAPLLLVLHGNQRRCRAPYPLLAFYGGCWLVGARASIVLSWCRSNTFCLARP